MTLLELVQAVADEMALARPNTVVSSQNDETRQIFALMNRLGRDLCRQHDWQRLIREHLLTTVSVVRQATTTVGGSTIAVANTTGIQEGYGVSGVGIPPFAEVTFVGAGTVNINMPATKAGTNDLTFAQIRYPLPADWKKQIPQTEWDRMNRWPLDGPQTGQSWQSFKSGVVYAGPRLRYRIMGDAIVLTPPPVNGATLSFEYISNAFVRDSSDAPKAAFSADSDTCVFDDSLMIAGTIAKFKQAKGLDATADLGEFAQLFSVCKGQDSSSATISLSGRRRAVLMSGENVPDGNWGMF